MPLPQWKITWIDCGRDPQHPPNPAYPEGIDLDMSMGLSARCTTPLPYPARRCGFYSVHCRTCGFTGLLTTAGHPNDPRSVTVACLPAPVFRTSEKE
jgi:hypothetical protein